MFLMFVLTSLLPWSFQNCNSGFGNTKNIQTIVGSVMVYDVCFNFFTWSVAFAPVTSFENSEYWEGYLGSNANCTRLNYWLLLTPSVFCLIVLENFILTYFNNFCLQIKLKLKKTKEIKNSDLQGEVIRDWVMISPNVLMTLLDCVLKFPEETTLHFLSVYRKKPR